MVTVNLPRLGCCSHLCHVFLQIVIKNGYCDHWRDNPNLISLGLFVCFFFHQKMRKSMTILKFILIKRIIYRKWYLFIFDTKMTISPHKVRHVSPSRDVWICMAAKYLHIDLFDQNPKKFEFSVSRYFTCHVFVKFFPLFGDHRLQRSGRGGRRFRAPRQWLHWWETE